MERLKVILTIDSLEMVKTRIDEKLEELQQAQKECKDKIDSLNTSKADLQSSQNSDRVEKMLKTIVPITIGATLILAIMYKPNLALTVLVVAAEFVIAKRVLGHHKDHRVTENERTMNEIAEITTKHDEKLEEIETQISVMQRATNIIEKLQITTEEQHQLQLSSIIDSIKECYNEDVITARAVTAIETFSITTKQLKCSPIIHSYLALRLFKQPIHENKSCIWFLSVKISVKDSLIQLEGTPAAISKEEKQLMAHFVPPNQLKHRTFEFTSDIRFFSVIEDLILAKQQNKDSTFCYLPATKSKSPDSFQPASSDKTGFSFTIFSCRAKQFKQVCCDLEVRSLHSLCCDCMHYIFCRMPSHTQKRFLSIDHLWSH